MTSVRELKPKPVPALRLPSLSCIVVAPHSLQSTYPDWLLHEKQKQAKLSLARAASRLPARVCFDRRDFHVSGIFLPRERAAATADLEP